MWSPFVEQYTITVNTKPNPANAKTVKMLKKAYDELTKMTDEELDAQLAVARFIVNDRKKRV